jgi:hypothetical protein
MSDNSELSTDVKTVLHGDVLGPEEEIPKKSKEQEEIEALKAKLAHAEWERQAYAAEVSGRAYAQQLNVNQLNMNQWLGGQFGYPQANLYGCMNHYSNGNWRCQNCGRY